MKNVNFLVFKCFYQKFIFIDNLFLIVTQPLQIRMKVIYSILWEENARLEK